MKEQFLDSLPVCIKLPKDKYLGHSHKKRFYFAQKKVDFVCLKRLSVKWHKVSATNKKKLLGLQKTFA